MNPALPFRLRSFVPFLLLLCAAPAAADTMTGRVVDQNGAGVPGVDIDVQNLAGGGNPHLTNDGTDANGFFTASLDPGVYRVLFFPPPPPATRLLAATRENVVVSGTVDLGVITLASGVALYGRAIDTSGVPVAGVQLSVLDVPTGTTLPTKGGTTSAFGTFAIAVPAHELDLDLDPLAVVGRTLAPRRLALAPAADTQLGDLVLQTGFALSGTIRNSAGAALGGIDLDVADSATGTTVFTPHDNTNSSGVFSMVLAAGTYDVDVCPGVPRRLVAASYAGLVLSAPTNVGTIVLQSGVVLSGTVRDATGVGYPGADVNVRFAPNGASVPLCSDNTKASGAYAVVVPVGTLDVGFALPGKHGTSGEDLHTNVAVGGDTVLDGVLPAPAPEFTGTPRTGAAPLAVSFTDLSTGAITAWSWSFGDGASSSLASPAHVFGAPGFYTVELTLSGPGGPATNRKVGYVVAHAPAPVADFSGAPTSGVAPLAVVFTNQSTGSIQAHAWSFGDGSSSSLASPTHAYAAPGTYTVSLTEFGSGTSDTLTRVDYVVAAEPPPVAEFSGTPTSGVVPLTVAFANESVGAIDAHLWSFGDGAGSSLASPSHTYTAAGTYTVSLTENGPGGSSTRTRVGYVVVAEPPPAAEFVGSPTSGLVPLTVAFTNQSTGVISTHLWSFGDGASSTLASPSHTYTAAGTYTVSLTESGPGGSSTRTRTDYVVVAEPPPVAGFTATLRRGRAPLAVAFEDLSSGAVTSWSWDFGDGTTSSAQDPTHVYRTSGSFTVRLTVSGPGGTDEETKTAYVVVHGPRR